jgi:hypothetical protein
VLPHWLK